MIAFSVVQNRCTEKERVTKTLPQLLTFTFKTETILFLLIPESRYSVMNAS